MNAVSIALLHGPYRSPEVQAGDWVECLHKGRMQVLHMTQAPIPWPVIGYRNLGAQLALYGDLVLALQQEPASAIAQWWGMARNTVLNYRRVLGLPVGDRERERTGEEKAAQLAAQLANNPRIWKDWELALAADPSLDAETIAARLGRPIGGVRDKRRSLGVLDQARYGADFDARLRQRYAQTSRAELAKELGCSMATLLRRAQALGLPVETRDRAPTRPWSPQEEARLLTLAHLSAAEVARLLGRTPPAIDQRRAKLAKHGTGGPATSPEQRTERTP